MSLASSAFRRIDYSSTVAMAGSVTALQAAEALGLELSAGATEAHAVDALRTHLAPLGDEGLRARLQMPDQAKADLATFLQGGSDASPVLLEALRGNPVHVQLLVVSNPAAAALQVKPMDPLAYPGRRTAAALASMAPNVEASVRRLLDGARERGGVASQSVPPAISLEEILAHPEQYRERYQEQPLEIVLFDVDDTTRRGQMWLEWLLSDVLRYGPKSSTGLGFGKLVKTLWRSVLLRIQEKKEGHADEAKSQKTIAEGIRGLSHERVIRSFDRYYEAFGRRGVTPYMKDEFAHHRVQGRLIVGISASPLYLVGRHAEDIGIPIGNVFGTTIGFDDKGIATGQYSMLRSSTKVEHLEEHVFAKLKAAGISFKLVAGYSDSDSDTPMLDLVRTQGGAIVATNAPREAFDRQVLGMGGQVVHETNGWPAAMGERETTIFSVPEAGTLTHRIPVPSTKPALLDDLRDYAAHSGAVAAGLAAGEPISIVVSKGIDHVFPGDLVDFGSLAAGSIAAGAAYFFLPKSGPVSGLRRWILQDMAPLSSAMYYASENGPFTPISFFLSVAASTLVTRTTLGALAGISRRTGLKTLEAFFRGRMQEVISRPSQMVLFRFLYPLLSAYEKRYGVSL